MDFDDYWFDVHGDDPSHALVAPEPITGAYSGMKLSSVQIILLQDLLERELLSLEPDHHNRIEIEQMLDRLTRMRAWREREYPERDFPAPYKGVWGRDYV